MCPVTREPPDPEQRSVLEHGQGPLLVTGGPGTGKTWALRERFARLIEQGQDPERVVLVVRSAQARASARSMLLDRLARPLPGMKVLTVHGLAYHLMSERFELLGYGRPPDVLSALDQFARVHDLLAGEDPADWPAYSSMLGLHGFADEVRQFLARAQEALLSPEEIAARAEARGLPGMAEVARFYNRYLDVLHEQDEVDFAGLLNQAANLSAQGPPSFDHVLVDDYQDATFAEEALALHAAAQSVVVAGDQGSHVFSFQGSTVEPLRRFPELLPLASQVRLRTPHRSASPGREAWTAPHESEEHAAVARELRRVHVVEGVAWKELAVVVRRTGPNVAGLLRALDDAGVPRMTPEGGLSLLAEPGTHPFVLAFRWLARPEDRGELVEAVLGSELGRLSPAAARGLLRAALSAGQPAADALRRTDGLTEAEAAELLALGGTLDDAERVAGRSVVDAFRILWSDLPYCRRLVAEADASAEARRALDAVLSLADAIARTGERGDASVQAFLEVLEGGRGGPGLASAPEAGGVDAVSILTAHGTAGLEFDTVLVAGTTEGNFPSLARPEPMFDLAALDGPRAQSERNRLRLEDERRLFGVVASRARRRVLFTASDAHGEDSVMAAHSRFVGELGVPWISVSRPRQDDPLSPSEASARWRRHLADPSLERPARLAALSGLARLGEDPSRWWFQRDWTGTARPLHETLRVSYSKLSTLENCGLQYVLSEELGLEGQAGYYAWVGHLVHTIIEDCENGVIDRNEEALIRAAEQRWSPQQFPSYAVSEAFRRLVTERMLPAWMAAYGDTAALAGEIRFEFDFDGAVVTGAIDRVSRAGRDGCQITDYKTGKSRGAPASEENLQLGIYFLAVTRAPELARFGPVKQVELAFLRERTLDGMVKRLQLGMTSSAQREFGDAMSARLGALVARIRELYRTETYRPSSQADCHFCDFKTLCPLWPEGRELFPLGARR